MLFRDMAVGEEVRIGPNVRVVFLGWANENKTQANIGFDAPREVRITWPEKENRPAALAGVMAGRRAERKAGR